MCRDKKLALPTRLEAQQFKFENGGKPDDGLPRVEDDELVVQDPAGRLRVPDGVDRVEAFSLERFSTEARVGRVNGLALAGENVAEEQLLRPLRVDFLSALRRVGGEVDALAEHAWKGMFRAWLSSRGAEVYKKNDHLSKQSCKVAVRSATNYTVRRQHCTLFCCYSYLCFSLLAGLVLLQSVS